MLNDLLGGNFWKEKSAILLCVIRQIYSSLQYQLTYVEKINISMLNVKSKNSFLPRGLKPKWSTGMGASVCACDLKYEDKRNLNNYPT